ncbi:Asp-tRNA(Asn)/Glu-tRNA(Gln) amidotransferase subunit GatB [Tichowtungia aerotolerans]|uniref:Aspartyl/glutamyl-tRNA(Asn/Gln) amidotransferase subunit B n=1 Tax=Tichowtungia aerotolerans TaxID=2697043 RepID=A0A6P1M641_9BACT|nr:Asp-tRNA(Asn)/Glu-tRNA(Gln) amidotransferase subunit GatB [Tichowtungia aerotolerans]QHI70050.1 Asp-tRNA(Asn)/Glu-tRNA(Gln) amidotransferase subunit GatB [Tichowtungia aerotolerans]
MKYEACIGLETHVMQKTQTKMFCSCKHEYGAAPNTNVCPVCLGYPGAMPVMNEHAIELICKAGLMIGCEINPHSKWDRKNYFYPDMSKNYQITQADQPLCLGGEITTEVNGETKTFTIERIHQEENAAKNTHVSGASLIDYNRAGTALMEIVSNPCMHSADDALAYMTALRQIMVYGGISDCELEKGHMRSDVNVSVRPVGSEVLGSKVEIKNMNSFSFIAEAINYEIDRQIDVLENGGTVVQETRGYDSDRGETFTQRTKEDAHDYRYFPEPDLMPVEISAEQLEQWKSELPELPAQRRERYISEFGLPEYDAGVLTAEMAVSDFFDAACRNTKQYKLVSNYMMGKVASLVTETETRVTDSKLTVEALAQVAELAGGGTISSNAANELIDILFKEGGDPKAIVDEKGMAQVSDDSQLEQWADEAIAGNDKAVSDYKAGNAASINALMGYVMKQSKGKANPPAVIAMLKQKLDS